MYVHTTFTNSVSDIFTSWWQRNGIWLRDGSWMNQLCICLNLISLHLCVKLSVQDALIIRPVRECQKMCLLAQRKISKMAWSSFMQLSLQSTYSTTECTIYSWANPEAWEMETEDQNWQLHVQYIAITIKTVLIISRCNHTAQRNYVITTKICFLL